LEDQQLTPTSSQQRAKWIPSRDWRVAKHTITEDRIRWAIETMDLYKSPGEDGIFPSLLQKGLPYVLTPICQIYRACIANSYIPQVWRHARVLFLPKPGKIDYTTAKVFRPISLTSLLLQVALLWQWDRATRLSV